jgi:sugar lactone lactonase YvrE
MTRFRTACLAAACAAASWAGGSATWESNSYADFIRGRFSGLSLTRDGRIQPGPKVDPLFASGQAAIWCLAAGPDGALYAGAGHRGRVYRIDPSGAASVLWTADQPEVFALAVAPGGVVFAATSPNGQIYRLESGKAAVYFEPKEAYIWSLALAPDGVLWAGTGESGKVYRIAPGGAGELWYETGQAHVTSLALDRQGRPLVGTEPNGILYRLEGKGKAFALYDASLPEIRSIVPAPDGSIYVAALGGALARQNAQAAATAQSAQPLAAPTATITVTTEAQAGIDIKPKAEAPKPAQPQPESLLAAPPVDLIGVEKAAIYRIAPDLTVDTVFSSKEENIFDLTLRGADVYFTTDLRGRIYRLTPDLKVALLAETLEGEATRLADVPAGLTAATSNMGKLFRLGAAAAPGGVYESPVHDAGGVARWGRLDWRGSGGERAFSFRSRTGNSARPDATWSDWSAPLKPGEGYPIESPNSRYVQWKVEFTSATAELEAVNVSYQPQNLRPVVRSVQVLPQWTAAPSKPAAAAAPATPSYSITVTESGLPADTTSGGTPTLTATRPGAPQLLVSWQADDPDGDRLQYALYFRGEEERDWKLVKDRLSENQCTIESETLADGRYFFRVEASDRLSNPTSSARVAELVSAPVLVDHTPPTVRLAAPAAEAGGMSFLVDAEDAATPLRRAEYSLDAGPWMLLDAADGITDGRKEQFRVRLNAPPAGEHLLVVRVFDAAGNAGLAKRVFQQP